MLTLVLLGVPSDGVQSGGILGCLSLFCFSYFMFRYSIRPLSDHQQLILP